MKENKIIVTVLGSDKVGIIATITRILADSKANILDISQTILHEYFTMIMVVDISNSTVDFADLRNQLVSVGEKMGVQVNAQKSEVFDYMHRI